MQKLKIACYLLGKEKHSKFGTQQSLKNLGSKQVKNQIFIEEALNGSYNKNNKEEIK